MPLNGSELRKLHQAILSGFNGSELEQLVRFDLNQRLENITSPGPLPAVVNSLVAWAEQQGVTRELIEAVRRARPNNTGIQADTGKLLAGTVGAAPESDKGAIDGPRRARLRSALIDQFFEPLRPGDAGR